MSSSFILIRINQPLYTVVKYNDLQMTTELTLLLLLVSLLHQQNSDCNNTLKSKKEIKNMIKSTNKTKTFYKMQCNLLYLRNCHSVNASRIGLDIPNGGSIQELFLSGSWTITSFLLPIAFGRINPPLSHLTCVSHCTFQGAYI